MEHRLGTRHPIDLDVYLRTWGSTVSARGRLRDLSVSGAYVVTRLPCQPLLHVTLHIVPAGRSRRNSIQAQGLIARVSATGIGIEWEDLQPELLNQFVLLEPPPEELRVNTTQCIQ